MMAKTVKSETNMKLSNGVAIHPFILSILKGRGVIGREDLLRYLEPKLSDIPDPLLMLGMSNATELVERTIKNDERIVVWGDYDVDGTTAVAVLVRFFNLCGYTNIIYHIPNRLTEGYGLNSDGLKTLVAKDNAPQLLITVDNGISSVKEIALANTLGFSCIVTDHHLPKSECVAADAVINPKQKDCHFPDKDLAGVGIAFYLCMAVRGQLRMTGYFENKGIAVPNLKQLLDLVAIGTVADMVPLAGVNRILVKAGLEVMSSRKNNGLTALCRHTNVDPRCLRSEDVSFQLGPKINAAGRLGNADKAVALFLSTDRAEADRLAADLVVLNGKRKEKNEAELKSALQIIEENGLFEKSILLVTGDFHIGVAGIVSANITEAFGKPSIVLCRQEDGVLKGSGRSVPGVNLFMCLEQCDSLLLGFGGHAMAGGMSLKEEMVEQFYEMLEGIVADESKGKQYKKELQAECDRGIADFFKRDLLGQLHLLEPFGESNPQLIIRDPLAKLFKTDAVGRDKDHLRFQFGADNGVVNGIGFRLGGKLGICREKGMKEVYYTPTLNTFRGKKSWEVRVLDVNRSV